MGHPLGVVDFRNRERVEPSIFSETLLQQNAVVALSSLSDVVLVGEFPGGAPDVVKTWLDVSDLAAYHDPDGTFNTAVRLAKRMKLPSADVFGASTIRTVRVGNPTQATADLFTSIRTGTAQGGAASSITLDAGASAVNDFYNGDKVMLTGGPGDGQVRTITDYDGGTKVATVSPAWTTNPTSASTFMVYDPLLTITTVDYGTQANRFKYAVSASGVKRTVTITWNAGTLQERSYTSPATGIALKVEYTGSDASAVFTVTKTGDDATRIVYATGVAGSEAVKADLDLTLTSYNTLAKVAAALAALADTTCVIEGAADATMSSAKLDAATSKSVKRESGTAQAGGASSITLAVGASASNDFYNGRYVTITGGTGSGQTRVVSDYDGGTKVATVDVAWTTTPDATSVYRVADFGVTSALGSIEHWFNSTLAAILSAARVTGATASPDTTTRDVAFTGGTYPATVLQDWVDAFEVVNVEDLAGGYVFVATDDETVYDALDTWRDTQKGVNNKMWRSVYATQPAASTDDIKAFAQAHSHRRTMVVCDQIRDLNDDGSALVNYDPLDLAAILCGMSSGARPAQPLTGLRVKARGLRVKRPLTEREDLMKAGVTVLKEVKGRGYEVAFALSSDLGPVRMPRVWAESIAADYIEFNVVEQLKRFVGTWATRERIVNAKGLVKAVLDLVETEGVISEGFDSNNEPLPAYGPITATLLAGSMRVGWVAYIGGEIDQIGVLGGVEYQSFGVDLVV